MIKVMHLPMIAGIILFATRHICKLLNREVIIDVVANILSHSILAPNATAIVAECFQGCTHLGDSTSFPFVTHHIY
jgi:hypothetical protein